MTFEPGAPGFSLKTDLITTLKSWIDGPVPRRHPISSVVVGGPRGFELQTSCAQGSCRKSILLVRLALFYVMVHGFGPNLAAFGPKLDPSFWGEPL